MVQCGVGLKMPSTKSTMGNRMVPFRGGRKMLQVNNAVKDVFMPALSSTMTEGKIVSWLKAPGDKVKKGEPIVVVESGTLSRYWDFGTENILKTYFR